MVAGTCHSALSCVSVKLWAVAIVTGNSCQCEGCMIRPHFATRCPSTDYGFSFSREQGAITKSLQATGEFYEEIDQHFNCWKVHHPRLFQGLCHPRVMCPALTINGKMDCTDSAQRLLFYTSGSFVPWLFRRHNKKQLLQRLFTFHIKVMCHFISRFHINGDLDVMFGLCLKGTENSYCLWTKILFVCKNPNSCSKMHFNLWKAYILYKSWLTLDIKGIPNI